MSETIKMANGDIVLDSAGRMVVIDGEEKLAQELAEALLNNYDPEDPPYHNGSELYKLDGMTTTLSGVGVPSIVEQMVQNCVARLMDLQAQDPAITDDELIYEIRQIRVWKVGHLTWAFHLIVNNNSLEPVQLSFDIDLQSQLPPGVAQMGNQFPGTGTFI